MELSLQFISNLPALMAILLFFILNFLITIFSIFIGNIIIWLTKNKIRPISIKEWIICVCTNILNTGITFLGLKLWQSDIITIAFNTKWTFLIHVIIIFFIMDLLMFLFHYLIHKTFLYKLIHGLHHQAIDPKPIDLFILHPIETLAFGFLWLLILCLFTFNIYAIIIYLIFNVIFGLIAHLGIEVKSYTVSNSRWLAYLGTSSFHHQHHQNGQCNYGFYTNIWDRILRTYVKNNKEY